MKQAKMKLRKALSWLLALTLATGMMPSAALATGGSGSVPGATDAGADNAGALHAGVIASTQAQETLTIGQGTKTDTTYGPFGSTYYKKSLNEQLYTAEEIGKPGGATIESIAFDVANAAAISDCAVSIFMGHTAKSSFEGSSDFITQDLEEVYSGTTSIGSATGLETYALDAPFDYDGTHNLVVVVLRTGSSYDSKLKYNCTETEGATTIISYSDGADFSTIDSAAKNGYSTRVHNARPNTTIGFGELATMYDVSVAPTAHGSVDVSRTRAAAGKSVTVTATPDTDYELASVTVTDADGSPVATSGTTFTMPAKSVTVNATFAEKPDRAISIASPLAHGALSASSATAKEGHVVAVTATPDEGYELQSITVTPEGGTPASSEEPSFVMPDANVTVSGTFVAKVDLSPALKDGSALSLASEHSAKWSPGTDAQSGRSFMQTTASNATITTTITSDKAGWLLFDWGFSGEGDYKNKFTIALAGDTSSIAYNYDFPSEIGPNSSTYQGKFVTNVIPINAGTTIATWTARNDSGTLAKAARIDNIRFVNEQTPVQVTGDGNTSASATLSGSVVTAVDPAKKVTFTASGTNGAVFTDWKKSASDTEDYSTATSFTQVVYDEPVSYYAYSTKIFEGNGTEEDPILMKTTGDLDKLATAVNNGTTFAGQYVKLANDIDFAGAEFAGIGSDTSNAFAGTFDGNEKAIGNVKLKNGLFNYTTGTAVIKDLAIGADLAFDKALRNSAGIAVSYFKGTLENVSTSGTVTTATDFGYSNNGLGGVVGEMSDNSVIRNCSSSATITPTKSYGGNTDPNVGGIVGFASSYSSTIEGCSFTGSIDATTGAKVSCVGGIAGAITSSTSVKNCTVEANVSASERVGGIVGNANSNSSSIEGCTYSGSVFGMQYVGGIAGYSRADVSGCTSRGSVEATGSYAGGIVGDAYQEGTIENNTAMLTTVDGSAQCGRIVGGIEKSNYYGPVVLAGNSATAGTLVNGVRIRLANTTAVADGANGATIGLAELPALARTYNGKEQTIAATDGSYELSGTAQATDAGTYEATAALASPLFVWSDETTGPKDATWTIGQADIESATIEGVPTEPQYATGSAIAPPVTVRMTLVEGEDAVELSADDIDVVYADNVKPGIATITVTGKGNFTGKKTASFRIVLTDAEAMAAFEAAVAGLPEMSDITAGNDEAIGRVEDAVAAYLALSDVAAGTVDPATIARLVSAQGKVAQIRAEEAAAAQQQAEAAQQQAEAAQQDAEKARGEAEAAKQDAKQANSDAEQARQDAEQANADAEQARRDAASAQEEARRASSDAAEAKKTAEGLRNDLKSAKAAEKTDLAKAAVSVARATYTGKALSPAVTVKLGSKTLKAGSDYTVSYANNTNAGTGVVVVSGKGAYNGATTRTFAIAKAANPLKVKAKKLSVKAKKVKKAAKTFKAKKAFKVTSAKGSPTFKKNKGNKKIAIAKDGTVTVKKGCKKGSYKITVTVTDPGNANFKKASKKVVLKVTVK